MQIKKCSICGEEKTIDEYNKHKGCKFGVRPQCKKCHSKQSSKWQKENIEHRKKYLNDWYEKNKDKVIKQREEYKEIKNKKRREKYKEDEEYRKQRLKDAAMWQKNNPKKRKGQRLKQYGITFEDFSILLKEAGNKCEICGYEDDTDKKTFPVVDHCHETNKVRGILCSKCNFALGHFNDSIENLKNAIKYLNKGKQDESKKPNSNR